MRRSAPFEIIRRMASNGQVDKRIRRLERVCEEDRARWRKTGDMFRHILTRLEHQGAAIERQGAEQRRLGDELKRQGDEIKKLSERLDVTVKMLIRLYER